MGRDDTPPKPTLAPPPKVHTLKLGFSFSCLLQATPHFSHSSSWKMKSPITVTAGRQDSLCSKAFQLPQQLKEDVSRTAVLYKSCLVGQDPASAFLSAPCIDWCKVLFLPLSLVLNFEDLLSLAFCCCFPKKLKQNYMLQSLVYSCPNSETKVWRSNGIRGNTVFIFGKMALKLFGFFLSLQGFAYCHEDMKFMVLILNVEKQLDFPTTVYKAFSFLPTCWKF